MWLGHVQIGDILTLLLWCRTAAGAPVTPDSAPTITIWAGGNKIEFKKMPTVPGTSGTIFLYNLFLGTSDFEPGKHYVVYEWLVSGVIKGKTDVFEIVTGGNLDGQGISMHFFRQPASDFVLVQEMSGRVLRRKNPSM